MDIQIIFQLLLAMWLWALIWIERWIKQNGKQNSEDSFWEIRTFALISFLWAFTATISIMFKTNLFIFVWALLIWLLILIYYIYWVFKGKQLWATTEIAWIITFFLWVFVMVWEYKIAIIMTIIITFLLSSKWFLERLTDKISGEELRNTIKFAVISVVMLPLLPDQKYSIVEILKFLWYEWDISNSILNLSFLNPYGIWFFVVLMAWISYVGYIMSKFIWEKWSILATWAVWWLVSSTAVTATMTEQSKKDTKNTNMYVVSTLLASTIMFVRVVIIVLFFNINLLSSILLPSIFMFLWMAVYILYFYFKWKKEKTVIKNIKDAKEYKSPFSIWPALKFAIFVLFIKFVSALWKLYEDVWWDYFYYAIWVISGLADVDAISQTMAVDSEDGKILASLAVTTIIISIMSNNLVKWSLALKFWERKFWISVMLGFVISMLMWVVWIVLMNII